MHNGSNHANTNGNRGSNSDTYAVIDMIENYNKVGASTYGPTAKTGAIASGGYTWNNIPKAEVYVKATSGRAEANASIFKAYAEGPSAGAGAGAAHLPFTPLASVFFEAEASLCKAGVKAGPLVAEFNPNLNTGASIGITQASVNILGFGAGVGTENYISTPLGKIGFTF